ncbi:MAG: hypothetical protein WAK93_02270 [Solirubrobacteraceae bacterium]
MSENPDQKRIQRIVLPSGRSVAVVRSEARTFPPRGLHMCPDCHCELVQPVRWGEAVQGFWELTLECPNCGWLDAGIFDREEVDLLEERLDEGLAQMVWDLRRLAEANMAEDIDRFIAALNADLILPEDF